VNYDSLLVRAKEEDIQQTIQTNLLGSIWMSKAVTKGMIQRKTGK
jgi:3-oxoacyl-[acyl-carrier protein] reductase/carbonyl reductase 4